MPVKRRIPKVRRCDVELTPEVQDALEGRDWFDVFGQKADPALATQRLREAWDAFGEEVLEAWIAQHPGTRPWAWWVCDAPEPRRRHVGGALPVCDEPNATVTVAESLSYGACRWIGRAQADDPPRYESQGEYLDRHGLLSQAERRAIASPGFEEWDPFAGHRGGRAIDPNEDFAGASGKLDESASAEGGKQ